MTTPPGDGGLGAALLQLSQHSQRIGGLDERENSHYQKLSESLADLHVRLTALRGTLRTQGQALEALRGLEQAVAGLAGQLRANHRPDSADEAGYAPIPAAEWWRLAGGEREQAIARLRSWVETIYRPLYGHLAAQLGGCWQAHPLALVTLDWLSELWSLLYLNPGRGPRELASQAELGTRILPAAAAILAAETRGCRRHGGHATLGTARP